jgi:transcriptional antiterminator
MKLSQQALKAINNPVIRRRLMDALGCTEFTIARYIQKNSDNLTKAAAMHVIREGTGLYDEQILEVTQKAKQTDS